MTNNKNVLSPKEKRLKKKEAYVKAREKERKLDAHIKIQLGGLVKKSGMDKYSKSVILGALIEAYQNIQNDSSYEKLYKVKGDKGFLKA